MYKQNVNFIVKMSQELLLEIVFPGIQYGKNSLIRVSVSQWFFDHPCSVILSAKTANAQADCELTLVSSPSGQCQ